MTYEIKIKRDMRWRAIAKAIGAGIIARGVITLVTLATVPLMLNYLGEEKFALWALIMSLLALVNFADFGLGNSLVTLAAEAYGRSDVLRIRGLLTNALALVVVSSSVLALLMLSLGIFVPWKTVFNLSSSEDALDARHAVNFLVLGTILALPLGLVYRLQIAVQHGASSSSWQAIASIASLAALVVGTGLGLSLPVLVALTILVPAAIALLNSCVYFGIIERNYAPATKFLSKDLVLQLARPGGAFLLLQIVSVISFSLDPFIVAHFVGNSAIVEYTVAQKVFGLGPLLLGLVLAPLWPAYGEAIANSDFHWARRTFVRALIVSVCVGFFASILLWFLSKPIVSIWMQGNVESSSSLNFAFAAWTIFLCLGLAISNAMNGLHRLRFQLWAAIAFLIVGSVSKVIGASQFGLVGLVWAGTLSYTATFVVPFFLSSQIDKLFQSQDIQPVRID